MSVLQKKEYLPTSSFRSGWAVYLTDEYASNFIGNFFGDLNGAAEKQYLNKAIEDLNATIKNQNALEEKAERMIQRLGFASLKEYFNKATLNKNTEQEDETEYMENFLQNLQGPLRENNIAAQKLRSQQNRYTENFLLVLDKIMDKYRNKKELSKKDMENIIAEIRESGEIIQSETMSFLQDMTELMDYIQSSESLQRRLKEQLDRYLEHEQRQLGKPIDIKQDSHGRYQIAIPKEVGTNQQRRNAIKKLRKFYDELEKNIHTTKEYNSLIHTNKTKAEKNSQNANKRIQWLINEAAKGLAEMYQKENQPSAEAEQSARKRIIESLHQGLQKQDETFELKKTKLRFSDRLKRSQFGGYIYEVFIHAKRQKLIDSKMIKSAIKREGEPERRTVYATGEINVYMNNDGRFFKTEEDIKAAGFNPKDFELTKKKVIQTASELNKIDNFFEIGVDNEEGKEETLTFAFSEKLLNYSNLSKVSIVGEKATLLSSFDLLKTDMGRGNNAANVMTALMLNLSTASIFYSQSARESLSEYLKKLLCSQFMSLAFNATNFEKSMEGMKGNVLYLAHASGGYTPAARILQPLVNLLENGDNIDSIIQGTIQFDDAHTSAGLYQEALDALPEKNDNRWGYVAAQVAANTKINMTLNLASIANLYML